MVPARSPSRKQEKHTENPTHSSEQLNTASLNGKKCAEARSISQARSAHERHGTPRLALYQLCAYHIPLFTSDRKAARQRGCVQHNCLPHHRSLYGKASIEEIGVTTPRITHSGNAHTLPLCLYLEWIDNSASVKRPKSPVGTEAAGTRETTGSRRLKLRLSPDSSSMNVVLT